MRYAKPDQSYDEHLEAAFSAWEQAVASKRGLIGRVGALYGITPEQLLSLSLLAVAFHDLGKMTYPFQRMMESLRGGPSFDRRKNYRHELSSFPFILQAGAAMRKAFPDLPLMPIEAIAVLGHHLPVCGDLRAFERERQADSPPDFVPGGLEEALEIAGDLFKRRGWDAPSCGEVDKNPYSLAAWVCQAVLPQLCRREGTAKIRDLFMLVKGLLHYADWYGSGKESLNYGVKKDRDSFLDDLRERCEKKGIAFSGLRPFQVEMGSCSGHLMAVAPTGSGKTEGSLLWALRNLAEMGEAKIIYLLPTMNTATKIWDRLVDIFGIDNVGLTHSTAELVTTLERAADGDVDSWEVRKECLFDKSFLRPVTVATVDQLLSSGFNAGRWALKEINAANAVIILDEIHSYDGWTLGLIVSAVKHFSRLGSRFLLMSATLPSILKGLLSEELDSFGFVEDDSFKASSRSRYEMKPYSIDAPEAFGEIRQAVEEGRKVLVVVNSVGMCQHLADELHDLDPLCYHSRFILKDRKAIEDKIESASFVIATQVVEVSLDMDYDWLFTECAPPDALVQRAGRVNRYRDPQRDSRVYIYRPSPVSGKIYNPVTDPDLLRRSVEIFASRQGQLTESDLLEMVDQAYVGYRIDETEAYQAASSAYKEARERLIGILDNRLREEKEKTRLPKYQTVTVIPMSFYEEVIDLKPRERFLYELKVPLWYFKENGKICSGLPFCEMKYDSSLGGFLEIDRDASGNFC